MLIFSYWTPCFVSFIQHNLVVHFELITNIYEIIFLLKVKNNKAACLEETGLFM